MIATALRSAQDERRPFTRAHLLAHGGSAADGSTGISLEDGVIDAVRLGELFAAYKTMLRGVVFCVCRSSDAGGLGAAVRSPAQELHRVGIEVVAASRRPLSAGGSGVFAAGLYRALYAEQAGWDRAIAAGRKDLRGAHLIGDAFAIQQYCATPRGAPSGAAARGDLAGLTKLLLSWFSPEELRRLIRWNYAEILDELPAGTSPASFADAVVTLLEGRRAINAGFFAHLRQERPRRVAEIDAIATTFAAR